ncbi:MAG TPA: VIT and VWA domain-containing protein [Nevskiaceae bacterium]|nr:VIT and VWA domain-containing protein [Nevskiaceae bacterium]
MRARLLAFVCCVFSLLVLPGAARAQEERMGGSIEARIGDQTIALPMLKTDISADVQGDLATVTVVQTFANPSDQPMHARYLFPLNHEAAVFSMQMDVGSERIRAQIQETHKAEQTYEKAKSEGKAAALLKEHRPNMFTQDIANLMPGLPIKVTLKYVQTVPKIDGAYELLIPLVVGPRFQPPGAQETELGKLPMYPPVHGLDLPPSVEPDRVSISISLEGGLPILNATSATHAITTQSENASHWNLTLTRGRVIDNRDFVLRYQLGGNTTQAALLTQRDARGGYFSLLIEPPAAPDDAQILPREMVFLLDCSGSMDGLPIEASKAFMHQALTRLRPTDHFRIIHFGDSATEYADTPQAVTPENIRRALRYTDSLRGQGGTMVSTGIQQALGVPPLPGTERIVVFLTDGYIGNDYELIGHARRMLGDARLYALGVGTGVNHFFLDEIGRAGRGFTRYMDPTEKVDQVAAELADRLQSPVLTDISVDWDGIAPSDVYPQALPDLFAGQSLRVQGRYEKPGDHLVRIEGNARGRRVTIVLPVHLPEKTDGGEAVSLVWARSAIKELMYQTTQPAAMIDDAATGGPKFDDIRARVVDLGLKFSLVTKWTSFVAVSEKVYNAQPEGTPTAPVPLPMVQGVSALAYGNSPTFVGSAAPEPRTWLGLLVVALTFALSAMQRRRRVVGELG